MRFGAAALATPPDAPTFVVLPTPPGPLRSRGFALLTGTSTHDLGVPVCVQIVMEAYAKAVADGLEVLHVHCTYVKREVYGRLVRDMFEEESDNPDVVKLLTRQPATGATQRFVIQYHMGRGKITIQLVPMEPYVISLRGVNIPARYLAAILGDVEEGAAEEAMAVATARPHDVITFHARGRLCNLEFWVGNDVDTKIRLRVVPQGDADVALRNSLADPYTERCPICLDPFSAAHVPYCVCPMGHCVGEQCVEPWKALTLGGRSCPSCREPIDDSLREAPIRVEPTPQAEQALRDAFVAKVFTGARKRGRRFLDFV